MAPVLAAKKNVVVFDWRTASGHPERVVHIRQSCREIFVRRVPGACPGQAFVRSQEVANKSPVVLALRQKGLGAKLTSWSTFGVKSSSAGFLAPVLAANKNLVALDLRQNGLGADGCRILSEVLTPHPGDNPGANLKSISHRCHPILVAFEWELT